MAREVKALRADAETASVTAIHPQTGHELAVGNGDLDGAFIAAGRWELEGWNIRVVVGDTGRRVGFVNPYDPLRCPECEWAGQNLGVHFSRAHGASLPPGMPRVVEGVAEQARAARAAAERNRRPRVGMYVVRIPSDIEAELYQIESVTEKGATLRKFNTGGEVRLEVSIPHLIRHYLPVGRWSKSRGS